MRRYRGRAILLAIPVALLVLGCSAAGASPSPTATTANTPTVASTNAPSFEPTTGPTPTTPPGGLNAVTAVKIARTHLQYPDQATIWGWASGPPWGSIDPPSADVADADDQVWAVVFESPIEIHPPTFGEVMHRQALAAIYLAHETGELLSSSTWAPPQASEIPPAMYGSEPIEQPLVVSITNNTELVITLEVNGEPVATFEPGEGDFEIDSGLMPAPPWHVEALTSTGRMLLELDMRPGDVWRTEEGPNGGTMLASVGARADLSCGRLDLWSGAPMGGPMPPDSFPPNDCEP
jgi:hypothetical protein